MTSPIQLAAQIRFHLSHLGETNDHHAFEKICLGLAKRRIVSNLMPATGPVSAGGDGGRDAESYWSALADELPGTSLFTALATNDRVVLAATIQRDSVPSKIQSDLDKICTSGSSVDRVLFFSVEPVPVAKRHELQARARSEHSVELDIWDAQAIAEELSSHDLFFLAAEHLHLPSSLQPEIDVDQHQLPEWYLNLRQAWRSGSARSGTMGELVELRDALRHSTLNDAARADLPEWLDYARQLQDLATQRDVLSRIDYEIILITAVGMGSLHAVEPTLRRYFARYEEATPDVGELIDAFTLLRLVEAMQVRGATDIRVEELEGWNDQIETSVDSMLALTDSPNEQAYLLTMVALLAHGPAPLTQDELDAIDTDELQPMPELYRELNATHRAGEPFPGAPVEAEVRDLNKGMNALLVLLGVLPEAPLVPMDQLTQLFDITSPILIDHPDYTRVRQGLDAATAERSGRVAAGHRAQARALSLLNGGRPIEALREIHAAKMYWLHGDAAEGAALMMLLASRVYEELRLPIAAKQYAMSAVAIARESADPELMILVARGLILAATYEHLSGQWMTATHTFRVGIWAQGQYAAEPWSFDRYPYFLDMLTDQCHILRVAKALRPGLLSALEEIVASTNLNAMTEPMLASAAHIAPLSEPEVAASAGHSGMGRPFADVGPTREYRWRASDNTWSVRTPNDRAHVLAAERFTAAAQIVFAGLASEDMLLLPGPIDIDVALMADDTDGPTPMFVPDGARGGRGHLVRLRAAGGLEARAVLQEVAAAVLQVIVAQSLLPQHDWEGILERVFDQGLPHMMTCVRLYDDLVDIYDDSHYSELSAADGDAIRSTPDQDPSASEYLIFPARLHKYYDENKSLEAIGWRYEDLVVPVRITIKRLSLSEAFRSMVSELRSEGWKDWHLLTAISNIAVNWRARERGMNLTTTITPADIQRFEQIMESPESESDTEIPLEEFAVEEMRFHLSNAARATAQNWGLEVRRNPIAPSALLDVLGSRFNYWSDDVQHEPVFEWP
ncbi:MAG: hypothetical protein PGN37_05115 [Mycobacterium kyogaense]|uniref:hypothetical protein n=1 Tax=Mycobacterium kyogaense TaxID=2212479 RepID=UPI002FF623D8